MSDALERRVAKLERLVDTLLRELAALEEEAGKSAQNVSIVRQGGA